MEAAAKIDDEFDTKLEEQATIKVLSAKELKALIKPKFQASPEFYYPTKTLAAMGYTRHQCPKCSKFYYACSPKQDTCGDTSCVGMYQFIGRGTGIGRDNKTKLTYGGAWKTYVEAFTK
jgi:alanyl-tRNA synthetase